MLAIGQAVARQGLVAHAERQQALQQFLLVTGGPGVFKAVAAHKTIHGPRGHLHAVELEGQGDAREVHGVAVVVLLAVVGGAVGVVVFGAQPEEGGSDVLGELGGQGDARAVRAAAAEDDVRKGESGQAEVLEAHTDLGVRLGDDPVNIVVADLDHLAVSAEGRAVRALAPVLGPDFKIDDTLEAFRRDDVDLRTDTGGILHLVGAVVFFKITVREGHGIVP